MVTRILTFYSSATDIIGNVAHFDYTLVVPLLLSFRMTYKVYHLLYAELLSQQLRYSKYAFHHPSYAIL